MCPLCNYIIIKRIGQEALAEWDKKDAKLSHAQTRRPKSEGPTPFNKAIDLSLFDFENQYLFIFIDLSSAR